MNTKNLIIVGGYAEAGKSSTIAYLSSNNIPVVSTSAIVHEITKNLFSSFDIPIDTQLKSETMLINNQNVTIRDILIAVAESVRAYDYLFFSDCGVGKLASIFQHNDIAAIESIGGTEYLGLLSTLSSGYPELKGDPFEIMKQSILDQLGSLYGEMVIGDVIIPMDKFVNRFLSCYRAAGNKYKKASEIDRLRDKVLKINRLNIRRHTEKPDADYRELLPDAVEYHNDGTLEDLYTFLTNYIS